jgi:hypothetical protein
MTPTAIPTTTQTMAERRRRHRFDIECEMRFRLLDSRRHLPQQSGKSINISSKGILFEVPADLPVGKRVELMIAWPAMLNEKCRLKMVAVGRIVRAEGNRVAALIQKHEFRTQGANVN